MLSAQKRLKLKSGRIGLISDTHGLMRPEALGALKGSELIIHAGDIGKPEVLEALERVAPTLAIRGNNDRNSWAKTIPDLLELTINGIAICVIHNVNEWDRAFGRDVDAVVSGHSHKPGVATRDGVLFVNPGSAGPRRFKLPIAVGRLQVSHGNIRGKITILA
ncbi:MAG TPA: metallophosphoesterase family protein [Candidatus Binatia bacterium]|nr:metallophosphoesterase family protein [Candidatus Binatia bacterium]